MTATSEGMPPVPTVSQKKQCTTCHKTLFFFDKDGVHIKCNICKSVITMAWEDVRQMYFLVQAGNVDMFASQPA